jgi:hypothetical protein
VPAKIADLGLLRNAGPESTNVSGDMLRVSSSFSRVFLMSAGDEGNSEDFLLDRRVSQEMSCGGG